tara:strand:- start:22751 stop:23836 length:1086 start_codon:yes stop_codon:yes gene_type:complete
MTEQDFIPKTYNSKIENGSYTWESPSNIALVKYWGKKIDQIPENPSISFTLNNCKTMTTLSFSKKKNDNRFSFEVYLEGEKKDAFKPKIETFFKRIELYLPFLKDYHFVIETKNTFPHSSGIASSASGMSALAMCLMSIEKKMNPTITAEYFIKKASFLSRLGSGSACRSIEGDLIVWGEHKDIENSSNLFGIKYPYEVHANFKNYQDTILLVDKGEKQVSSTVGHNLMHQHPFAAQRFVQANENLTKLIPIFKSGDVYAFIEIVESEALTLHAMMMTSLPYFILMKPNTLKIINKIWEFREISGLLICFTLDAGANVHVLYPEKESVPILEFIKNELVAYCQNGHYICDKIGFGAKQLTM